MRVPLLDLTQQYASIREEVMAAIARVCERQQFILGAEVEAFEQEVAERLDVRHAIGVSSGTDALLVALMAFGVEQGDEVITPTYSFFATAGCVTRLGARPVLVDVDPVTLNMTADGFAAAITPRTKAVIPVHLFGQAVDLDPLIAIARKHGVAVIEDAAQAIGGRDKGRLLGGLGDVGCFSFFPSKNLGAFGDAGLVTTNNDALAQRVRLLRNHGQHPKYYHHLVGGNFRIDALQAAILRVKLPHLPGWTEARRTNAARYAQLFAEQLSSKGVAGSTRLRLAPPAATTMPRGLLALPVEQPQAFHIFNQYVIRTGDRDALRAHLAAAGVGTEIYYPVPFHLQTCFESLGYGPGAFPVAEAAASDSLALPIYGELTAAQQRHVVESIVGFYAEG